MKKRARNNKGRIRKRKQFFFTGLSLEEVPGHQITNLDIKHYPHESIQGWTYFIEESKLP